MKYQCVVPILINKQRIRVNDIVEGEVADLAGDNKKKHFVACNKVKPSVVDAPMTISDLARAKQYSPPVGRPKQAKPEQ